MNRILYSLLFYIALPFIAVRLVLRSCKAPLYRQRMGERFSLGLPPMRPGGLWIHAVSVGESIAAAPMVRALIERHPDLPVTVTCMTPTGSERIRALFGDQVQHCYLPYDVPCAVARFLDHVRPTLAVIMETELWPNYIHQCTRRGIPVALANARLSARSAKGYGRLEGVTRPMLSSMDWIAVQTPAEAGRFTSLGARPECVTVTGSIKFDLSIDPALISRAEVLREAWGHRPVWIAASTHAGEDEILLAAHTRLRQHLPDALMILVPRHPERFDDVYKHCQQSQLSTARRSKDEPVAHDTVVYLGDTMGELLFLYAAADVAFVGGSLIERGGHNLLEPAALGKPVLSGPHVFNFLDIAAQLRDAQALRDVRSAEDIAEALQLLLTDEHAADQMRQGGLAVLKANQGALQRLLDGLDRLIRHSSGS
ncbi:lipid IV(A) 3-deoxy-D-manno-octulosonic acid transferase [Pseudomonas luteola]|uniref:lipid IV(A) 3-deoxy-D-manno-octulosonic acid transferase n=1 Tax=Pseudomonas luteola TaxID=47886 RepID=UPI001EF41E88|nr:lipid IV(A) 3-deoxy-D-manno-octulosonic acid transferase [Pseudomonas luteola]MCG7372696.1 lipid IV(A) 3-deoxy-D-manno-octulosonic acid transferase [Pseudomonas luteola]